MFERFTNLAKRSLTYAQDEAITFSWPHGPHNASRNPAGRLLE